MLISYSRIRKIIPYYLTHNYGGIAMGNWGKQEKDKYEEYKRKPFINFADSMNRLKSVIGTP